MSRKNYISLRLSTATAKRVRLAATWLRLTQSEVIDYAFSVMLLGIKQDELPIHVLRLMQPHLRDISNPNYLADLQQYFSEVKNGTNNNKTNKTSPLSECIESTEEPGEHSGG